MFSTTGGWKMNWQNLCKVLAQLAEFHGYVAERPSMKPGADTAQSEPEPQPQNAAANRTSSVCC